MTALVVALLAVIAALLWAVWAQRREIERLRGERDDWRGEVKIVDALSDDWSSALIAIADATRDSKSGTAKMVHRMAMEALK